MRQDVNERHLREADRFLYGSSHWNQTQWDRARLAIAAALEAAERRGIRAGLVRAACECELVDAEEDLGSKGGAAVRCADSIRSLDPATVEVEGET